MSTVLTAYQRLLFSLILFLYSGNMPALMSDGANTLPQLQASDTPLQQQTPSGATATTTSTPITASPAEEAPQILIVCVIDQYSYHLHTKLMPYYTGGIKELFTRGLSYTQAFYPHARPATATGHTAIQTGAYGKFHGIISNEWPNSAGVEVSADEDTSTKPAGTFTQTGVDANRKTSGRNIMCAGLPNEWVRAGESRAVISLSHKSRSATCMAGRLDEDISGTGNVLALWLDEKTGMYTTAQSYCAELPAVVKAHNEQLKLTPDRLINWQACNTIPNAYDFPYVNNYTHTTYGKTIINTKETLKEVAPKNPFDLFCFTPDAVDSLFTLSKAVLRQTISGSKKKSVLLFISVSSLDLVGHNYGPASKEALDIAYQIDKRLGTFIKEVETEYPKGEITWVLTADHGVMHFPEFLVQNDPEHANQKLIPAAPVVSARRVDSDAIVADLNKTLRTEEHLDADLINLFDIPYFYFSQSVWKKLSPEVQENCIATIKKMLRALPGIKYVWTPSDFESPIFKSTYGENSLEHWFAAQYYPGRSGDILVMVNEYTYLTNYKTGTSHCTPYDYDTHVPLAVVFPKTKQESSPKPGIISTPTSMLSLAPTLATLLGVTPPACSSKTLLPGMLLEKRAADIREKAPKAPISSPQPTATLS